MSKDKQKRAPDTIHSIDPESDDAASLHNNVTGRVKHDERGNAVWEWAISTGSFGADAASHRLKKLDVPTLTVADDAPTPLDVAKSNPLGTVKGYSPYDSGVLAKKQPPRKRDLRKLGEWIKLKRQAEKNQADADETDDE